MEGAPSYLRNRVKTTVMKAAILVTGHKTNIWSRAEQS